MTGWWAVTCGMCLGGGDYLGHTTAGGVLDYLWVGCFCRHIANIQNRGLRKWHAKYLCFFIHHPCILCLFNSRGVWRAFWDIHIGAKIFYTPNSH